MGRLLHDGHLGDDRRVQGSPPACRGGRALHDGRAHGRRGDRSSTRSRSSWRAWSKATSQSRWDRRRRERMLDELTDHFIICGFGRMGEIIAREFARQKVPFVVIERDPERMQQAIDAGLPRGRGRREQRGGAEAGADRARARLHRRGQHRRRERLRRPDARGCSSPISSSSAAPRPRTPGPSWCAPARTASSRRTRSAGCSWRRPRSVRRSSTSSSSRPAPTTSN